jgi:hypothetical protein
MRGWPAKGGTAAKSRHRTRPCQTIGICGPAGLFAAGRSDYFRVSGFRNNFAVRRPPLDGLSTIGRPADKNCFADQAKRIAVTG